MSEKLNVELKKEYKGGVKEFAYLTNVSSYISEQYGEILDSLTTKDVSEILLEELKGKTFAAYKDAETPVKVTFRPFDVCGYTYEKNKNVLDSVGVHASSRRELVSRNNVNDNTYVNIADLYFVSDEAALEDARSEYLEKKVEAKIQRMRDNEKERQKDYAEAKRLREKYGLAPASCVAFAAMFEKFEEATEPQDKLLAFQKVADQSRFAEVVLAA